MKLEPAYAFFTTTSTINSCYSDIQKGFSQKIKEYAILSLIDGVLDYAVPGPANDSIGEKIFSSIDNLFIGCTEDATVHNIFKDNPNPIIKETNMFSEVRLYPGYMFGEGSNVDIFTDASKYDDATINLKFTDSSGNTFYRSFDRFS